MQPIAAFRHDTCCRLDSGAEIQSWQRIIRQVVLVTILGIPKLVHKLHGGAGPPGGVAKVGSLARIGTDMSDLKLT